MSGPILYLTGEFPRASDTFIQREIAGLRAHGFDVRPASIRRTGPEHIVGPEQAAFQAETFHVLAATRNLTVLVRAKLHALRRPGRFLSTLALAWRTAPRGVKGRLFGLIYFAEALVLARHLQGIGAAHLHNHIAKSSGTVAMLASALSDVPYSFTLHGPDEFFAPEQWRLDAKIARATFVACISRFARSQAMLWSDPGHWDRLHVVHCGVDPARYTIGGAGPGTRLVFVGRLSVVKGVPVLLQALAAARRTRPELTLTLVGDGPDRRALEVEAQALDLGGAVRFLGYRGQDDVAAELAAHDMMVLPSFAEGVPVVLMEALAAGLPAIATRVGGVGELIVEGETGLTVPPGDVSALSDAILRLAGDPDLRRRLGVAGRALVADEFDADEEAARLGVLFMSYATGAPRPAIRPGDPS
nr:glycosyltransferase family 4 protein [Wenxinia marina]